MLSVLHIARGTLATSCGSRLSRCCTPWCSSASTLRPFRSCGRIFARRTTSHATNSLTRFCARSSGRGRPACTIWTPCWHHIHPRASGGYALSKFLWEVYTSLTVRRISTLAKGHGCSFTECACCLGMVSTRISLCRGIRFCWWTRWENVGSRTLVTCSPTLGVALAMWQMSIRQSFAPCQWLISFVLSPRRRWQSALVAAYR
mmetsp:Transcript_118584/g.335455  ORF Transcript_118584/g.335455 Transcript_118584/m.335455 type:complete len:203 (+) Transcript_118584:773-1381(+)